MDNKCFIAACPKLIKKKNFGKCDKMSASLLGHMPSKSPIQSIRRLKGKKYVLRMLDIGFCILELGF